MYVPCKKYIWYFLTHDLKGVGGSQFVPVLQQIGPNWLKLLSPDYNRLEDASEWPAPVTTPKDQKYCLFMDDIDPHQWCMTILEYCHDKIKTTLVFLLLPQTLERHPGIFWIAPHIHPLPHRKISPWTLSGFSVCRLKACLRWQRMLFASEP